jgi:hypothetical protein
MSLVLASDYRVTDFDSWWSAITHDLRSLARLSAHHLVIYRSIEDANRVFVTIGVHDRRPLEAMLRSADVLSWFTNSGVEDVPPLFAGEVVEKLDLHPSAEDFIGSTPVIVAGIVPIADFDRYWQRVHADTDRLRDSGVLRFWTYRAFDDPNEVMVLQEVASEQQAHRLLHPAQAVAEWTSSAGVGVYPPLFIGRLIRSIEVPPVVPVG